MSPRNPLFQELLRVLYSEPDTESDAQIKAILWDARAATISAEAISDEERDLRLASLDEIGRVIFSGPGRQQKS